jgi:hypothetical protein
LPVKLIDTETGKVNENYFVINILNFIEAYNMEKTKFTYDEEYNYYLFLPPEIVLNVEVCSKYDIFRESKDYVGFYVSEKIKRIIEENEWVGFEFYKYQTDQ